MEVIHVVLGKANPERMNGVNKVVHELATQQAMAGTNVAVWGITKDITHNYPDRAYSTVLFKKSAMPFAMPADMAAMLKTYAGKKVVFHLHGGFIPQMYAVARRLKKLRIAYVFTPHGSYNRLALKKSWFSKAIYMSLFEKSMLSNAAVVHVLGGSEVAGVKHIDKQLKAKRIPYGYHSCAMIDNEVKMHQPFIVGYCGRIDIHTKGLDVLVQGFGDFNSQHPDSQLWIVGDGAQLPALKKMIAGRKIKNVVFFGAQFGYDKMDILSECSVFAHPSRNEGLPAAILEAAALGLPCLVTNETNVAEYVRKYNAGVVEKVCPNAIAEGLTELHAMMTSGLGTQLVASARQMVREAFNWDDLVIRFNDMYRAALA